MARMTIALAALAAAMPLRAESPVAVESVVFVEHSDRGGLTVEPSDRFTVGDRVVTLMTWQAPERAHYTIVTAVPPRLDLQSVSRDGLEYSTDGMRTWRVVDDARGLPSGVTHLRWRTGGDGRLTYRAIVREP